MVVVVPHDPAWAAGYAQEASAIAAALPGLAVVLHHIGSTAVPGICAKPILDLLGEVPSLAGIDARSGALEGLGYEAMGAFGIAGRRYFRKRDEAGRRTHHLHVFQRGSPHLERHLAFRDYLIAHPESAAAYSDLKSRLMHGGTAKHDAYQDRKDAFVAAVERDAVAWYRARR